MIIAVDFDGVIVSDKFPLIGDADFEILTLLGKAIDKGHQVILWTCRVGDRLREAEDWCRERRLRFTCVNGNSPTNLAEYKTDPRKIYADIYIDDRAIGYNREVTVGLLKLLIKEDCKCPEEN